MPPTAMILLTLLFPFDTINLFFFIPLKSGNSSVVEHRLAKARVGGSNPLSRSKLMKLQIEPVPVLVPVFLLSLNPANRFLSCIVKFFLAKESTKGVVLETRD